MVSIHSGEENEFVRSYVQKQAEYSKRVWIGLKRNISQGFKWIDKSAFDYSKWNYNQPDNAVRSELYVEMLINENGVWNDLSDNNLAFICEIKCRNGWTRYKHKCLKFFDVLKTHSDAEKICQSNFGTLISIHSAKENKFAIDLAEREKTRNLDIWIGAKRNNYLNYFEWTNGQEFNYNNWASGQPKNSTDPESHVFIDSDGTWGTSSKAKNGLWKKGLFLCESNSSVE
jgi:hypothetical protein